MPWECFESQSLRLAQKALKFRVWTMHGIPVYNYWWFAWFIGTLSIIHHNVTWSIYNVDFTSIEQMYITRSRLLSRRPCCHNSILRLQRLPTSWLWTHTDPCQLGLWLAISSFPNLRVITRAVRFVRFGWWLKPKLFLSNLSLQSSIFWVCFDSCCRWIFLFCSRPELQVKSWERVTWCY